MPKYLYVAKEKEGQTVRGEVEAPDKARALVILREKDLLVLKLEESKKSGRSLFSSAKAMEKSKVPLE